MNNKTDTMTGLVQLPVAKHFSEVENLLTTTIDKGGFTRPNVRTHYKTYIPPELLDAALKNEVLETLPNYTFGDNEHDNFNGKFSSHTTGFMTAFFDTYFHPLKEIKVTEDMAEKEMRDIATKYAGTLSGDHYMKKVIMHYVAGWVGVKQAFKLMQQLSSVNAMRPAHINAFTTFTKTFTLIPDLDARCRLAAAYGAVCEINKNMGIHEVPEVLTATEIRQLLFAAPVLFNASDNWNSQITGTVASLLKLTRPEQILMSIFNDISGRVNASENSTVNLRRTQDLPRHETYPEDIAVKVKTLANLPDMKMDQTVILTPYTDFRLKELNDPTWTRFKPLDPYAITFFHGMSHGIMLRRWSGDGVLPAVQELMANTVLFLTNAKETIIQKLQENTGFIRKDYKVRYIDPSATKTHWLSIPDFSLEVDNIAKAFKEGKIKGYMGW